MNEIILSGNVGQDPTPKTYDGGNLVSFSLATTRQTKKTDWHNIIAFGKLAEVISSYVKKGDRLIVIGELNYRDYEKDGVKHRVAEIIARDVDLPPRQKDDIPPVLTDGNIF